ncbi:hypothetical protein WJX74_009985 [Apatococcus lobatus]|uniref:Uncharacterized protein n=1 Tax=Apatococcus lobatus TaxID=904363 RepID=A0AAW1R1Q5_9CHLO
MDHEWAAGIYAQQDRRDAQIVKLDKTEQPQCKILESQTVTEIAPEPAAAKTFDQGVLRRLRDTLGSFRDGSDHKRFVDEPVSLRALQKVQTANAMPEVSRTATCCFWYVVRSEAPVELQYTYFIKPLDDFFCTHSVNISILDINGQDGKSLFDFLCKKSDAGATSLMKMLLQHNNGKYSRRPACRAPLISYLLQPDLMTDSPEGSAKRMHVETLCESIKKFRDRAGGCNEAMNGKTPLGLILDSPDWWTAQHQVKALNVLRKVLRFASPTAKTMASNLQDAGTARQKFSPFEMALVTDKDAVISVVEVLERRKLLSHLQPSSADDSSALCRREEINQDDEPACSQNERMLHCWIWALAAGSDLKVFKKLLSAGLSPLELARGSTPLHLVFGHPEGLQKHGLDGRNHWQQQAGFGDVQQLVPQVHKIIKALVSAVNADLNQAMDAEGYLVLQKALLNSPGLLAQHLDQLVKHGASVLFCAHTKDATGHWSVLSQALSMKAGGRIDNSLHIAIIEHALAQYTLPHLEAILTGHLDMATESILCDWIITHRTKLLDPILKDKSSVSHILEVAADQANNHVLRLLLMFTEMPAVMAAIKDMNVLPLVGRVEAGLLRQVLSLGAACHRRDPATGGSAVHKAMEHGKVDHLPVLRDFMDTFNAPDSKGRLPMEVAKRIQVVKSSAKAESGMRSPEDHPSAEDHLEQFQLLLSAHLPSEQANATSDLGRKCCEFGSSP